MKKLGLILVVSVLCGGAAEARVGANCARTSTGMTPLTELGDAKYGGYAGGLYPGGRNAPSAAYLKTGKGFAAQVRARSPVGAPDPAGKIVLLSIGMSNTTQEFRAFHQLLRAAGGVNPRVALVDGAQGGQDSRRVADPNAPFWTVVDERLAAAGATRAQVQAVWLKEATAGENRAFPQDAKALRANLRRIVVIMRGRFPNLKLVFLSSRIYAGYASTSLNPEPIAYQTGFAVRWLIQERIERRLRGPWVGWGPYLWADGTRARRDGLTWECADFAPDGTHPSEAGRRKVARLLRDFFTRDPLARGWFAAA